MADGPESLRKRRTEKPTGLVESLANEALRTLAQQRVAGKSSLSERYVKRLQAAVLDANEDRRWNLVEDMIVEGVTLEAIIDIYIPTVARRLGEDWCDDNLGFADVTVGSARLQGMLRELSRRCPPAVQTTPDHEFSVIVIADEFHSLGAMVLTAQLRRMGFSVKLLMGAFGETTIDAVTDRHFDAIMISASHSETLASLQAFIKKMKRELRPGTPIVVGGPILNNSGDVAAATGAHLATSDVVEALRVCQLNTPRDTSSVDRSES